MALEGRELNPLLALGTYHDAALTTRQAVFGLPASSLDQAEAERPAPRREEVSSWY